MESSGGDRPRHARPPLQVDAGSCTYRPCRRGGAALAEQHDEWIDGRRYLGLDVLARCRIRPVTGTDTDSTASEEVTIPALSA